MGRPKKEQPNHGNLYEIKVAVSETMDGKPTRKSFYSPISKADAHKQAEQYKVDQAMGHIKNTKLGFERGAKDWLEINKASTVAANTYEYTYKNSVNNHLIPYFGQYALANIRKDDIQKFFNERKYMSNSLLHKLDITLFAIFENAIENDIIYKNPCKHVIIPSSERAEKEMHAYTAIEARLITNYAKTVSEGNSIIIMLKSGIRRGELLGLRWKDVDITNKIMHIRQSVKETRGALEVGPPKTRMSARDIPFDDELVQVLNSIPKEVIRYKGRNKERIAYTVKNDYVIADIKGGAMYPSHWQQRIYAPFMESLKDNIEEADTEVPALNAHELRHTYGTLLYKSGTDIYTIQKLMGHASIEITTRIYVHNDIETIKKAIRLDW